MTTQRTALVTGANKGIGFETVRRLAGLGWTVWLGARDEDRLKEAVRKLGDLVPGGDVRPLLLDVTSDESVSAARGEVERESGRLDVLVNNAGISGQHASPADTVPADFLPVYGVNVLGPVRMTAAFLDLLRKSDEPRLVMVSSGMGSFALTTDPDRVESSFVSVVYPSSKAALNMVTSQYARAFPDVRVCAVDPGYTATDFNAHRGTQTVEQGAQPVIRACVDGALPGVFLGTGGVVAW
jgi:NAD(P)-dependent dehydrogenase (short-subunit alcohol dehydrogenase family)